MKMKIRQMAKWFAESFWVTPLVIFVVLILGNIMGAVVNDGTTPVIFGTEVSFFIGAFVLGVVTFSVGLRFGVANGVSRRSIFLGLLLCELIFSLVNALAVLLLAVIGQLFLTVNVMTLFDMLYSGVIQGGGESVGGIGFSLSRLVMVPWCTLGVFCAMLVGGFVGGVFYRLGRMGKVLWAVGLPTALFVLFPTGIALLPEESIERIGEGVKGFFHFIGQSPLNLVWVFLGSILLFGGVVWLLMRRASIKTA